MYDKPPPSLNALRVIVVALLLGMTTASVVFVMLILSGNAKPAPSALPAETFVSILGALALGTAMMLLIVPPMLIKQAAARYRTAATDADREAVVLQIFSNSTIVRCAMVEGVGLFGAVIYFLTGMCPVLLAPALAAVVILAFFPTKGKLRSLRERLEMTGTV